MKRFLWITLCLCVTLTTLAQKQQGIVRTIERPGQKSVGINGVTIKINEYPNAIVSGKGGKFSFTLQGKKQGDRCLVTRVEKKGYTLIDKMPSFAYSFSTPAEIVMVSNKQLQQDEKKIRDKAQKEAEANYHKRIADLERQLQEKTISEEKYREQLQHVFDGYENYLKMIDEMARRYAMTDFKGISEINRQIQECIENAELERADSLINSKGDLNRRNQELQNKKETVQQLAELQNQAQEDYETSLNDLAQDYYNKHLICAAKYQNDSAAYWLEQRAALDDTTHIEWVFSAGQFIDNYISNNSLALTYYQKALSIAETQYAKPNQWEATALNNIGTIYGKFGNSSKALECHFKALEIDTLVFGFSSVTTANALNNIGYSYYAQGDFEKALYYYDKTLYIEKQFDAQLNMSNAYNNIALVYYELHEYRKAIEHYLLSMGIREKFLGVNHYLTAQSYNNIGAAYVKDGNNKIGIEYILKAMRIYETVLGNKHPKTASSYNNLGRIYEIQGDYENARYYLFEALKSLSPNDPHIAFPYNNIASTYYHQGDFQKAVQYYSKALLIFEKISPNHPNTKVVRGSYDKAKEALEQQNN